MKSGIANKASTTRYQQDSGNHQSHQEMIVSDNRIGTMKQNQIPVNQSVCSMSSSLALSTTQNSIAGPAYQSWQRLQHQQKDLKSKGEYQTLIGTSVTPPTSVQSNYQMFGASQQRMNNPSQCMGASQLQYSGVNQPQSGLSQPQVWSLANRLFRINTL